MLIWVPAQPASPGRDRGGPLSGRPLLGVGPGGGHHRVLRRDRPCRAAGAGATSRWRQARPGTGQGIPDGGHPRRGWRRTGHQQRHPARRDPVSPAEQHRPVRPRRAFRQGMAGDGHRVPASRTTQAGRGHLAAGPLCGRLRGHGGRHPRARPGATGRGRRVLATMGLGLSEAKTRVCHIDEGMDFLGWRIQRHQQRGSTRRYVYTYPSKRPSRSSRQRCGR